MSETGDTFNKFCPFTVVISLHLDAASFKCIFTRLRQKMRLLKLTFEKAICNRGVCLFLHIFMDTFRGKDRGIKKGAWSCFPYTFFVIF